MKKIFVAGLLTAVAVFGFAASEELEVYSQVYNTIPTHETQLSLLQTVAAMEIAGAGEFYAQALNRLVKDYQNIKVATEREYADEQALMLSNLLGQEKYAEAAADLWRVADSFPAPLVKSEALMALGKIRAEAFLPQVIRVLEALNAAPAADRLSGERIAYGAIIALEKYQDMSGYLPVYFAAIGWYSDRIKSQARKTLAVISADPSEYMTSVVRGAGYNYPTKLAALGAAQDSSAPAAGKSGVAVAALDIGWGSATADVRLRGQLNLMRKNAMSAIRAHGASDEAVYPLLERSYKQFADRADGDRDEAIDAVITLRTLATEEAARRLSGFLMTINAKQQSGTITRKDEDLAREIIPALGATKQRGARQALNVVNSINWTPAVKTLAQEALKQIP